MHYYLLRKISQLSVLTESAVRSSQATPADSSLTTNLLKIFYRKKKES